MADSGFGFSNYFVLGVVTANSSATDLGPTNLALQQCDVSSSWQTENDVTTADGGALLHCDAPTVGSTFRAFCLARTNLTSAAVVTFTVWHVPTLGDPVGVASTTVDGPQPGFAQVVAVLPADVTGEFVQVEIDDPANPDGFIRVGGAYAGPMWFPRRGISWDSAYRPQPRNDRTVTDGGQEFRTPRYRQRTWTVTIAAASDAEASDQIEEMLRVADSGTNILFVKDQSSPNINKESLFGTLDLQSPVGFAYHSTDARSATALIVERL